MRDLRLSLLFTKVKVWYVTPGGQTLGGGCFYHGQGPGMPSRLRPRCRQLTVPGYGNVGRVY
jgi:hypothetical protein